jgi:polyhydroxyalkanoate synthesis repressor PhaR
MVRLIKRYGSRKLYDTEESRYVLLEDIAAWIRQDQEIRVIDNKSAEDVTAQTLTQIISEEGRRGTAFLPNDMLHEIIRMGQDAVSTGVVRLQQGVGRFVQASIDRLAPVRQARQEMDTLKRRLEELEMSLVRLEAEEPAPAPAAAPRPRAAAPARKAPAATRSRAKAGKPRTAKK